MRRRADCRLASMRSGWPDRLMDHFAREPSNSSAARRGRGLGALGCRLGPLGRLLRRPWPAAELSRRCRAESASESWAQADRLTASRPAAATVESLRGSMDRSSSGRWIGGRRPPPRVENMLAGPARLYQDRRAAVGVGNAGDPMAPSGPVLNENDSKPPSGFLPQAVNPSARGSRPEDRATGVRRAAYDSRACASASAAVGRAGSAAPMRRSWTISAKDRQRDLLRRGGADRQAGGSMEAGRAGRPASRPRPAHSLTVATFFRLPTKPIQAASLASAWRSASVSRLPWVATIT